MPIQLEKLLFLEKLLTTSNSCGKIAIGKGRGNWIGSWQTAKNRTKCQ